jgi:hypothetical protein
MAFLVRVCPEMPENEEAPTAVYAKMVHKGVADDVNRAISGQTLVRGLFENPVSLARLV